MSVQDIDNTALNLVSDLVASGEHFGPVQALEDLQKWLTRSFTRSFAPTFAPYESIFSIHAVSSRPRLAASPSRHFRATQPLRAA
jgi:hypothetical protein